MIFSVITKSKIVLFHIAYLIHKDTALIKFASINLGTSLEISMQHFSSKKRQFMASLHGGNVNSPD